MIVNQMISLMFDIKTFYSRKLKCTGTREDFTIIISPPRLRLELCNSDTYVYCDIDPHLYLVMAMMIV